MTKKRPSKAKKHGPVYPKLELPKPPKVPLNKGGCRPRPDCEGEIYAPADVKNSPVTPPVKGKARILIAVPVLSISYEFFESFLKFWTGVTLEQNPKYEVGYHFCYRKPVHMAEELLVETARFNKCTHILLMDDDIYDITPKHLETLFDANKDVIGGVMYASKFPHAMCVFRRYEPQKKVIDMPVDDTMYRLYEVPCLCPKCGTPQSHWDAKFCPSCGAQEDNMIQRADLIPFAFTLIKMSVFDKIKKPWFHCTNDYPTDSWFADRLEEAGIQEFAHMGVRLNHAGINDLTKPFFANIGLNKARAKKAVVELTPDQMETHQDMLMKKMTETEDKLREKLQFVAKGKAVTSVEETPKEPPQEVAKVE